MVYRPAKLPGVLMQSNEAYHIAYDAQWISTVKTGEYFFFYAWPGAHVIQPPIKGDRMAADDKRGSSTINLDVKPGETYYIKTTPSDTTHLIVGAEAFAPTLMDKDTAQKELADTRPVEWTPDIDAMETSAFKRTGILNGTLLLQDDSLLLQLKPGSAEAVPTGVTIPYADIASVETRNKMMRRIVVITRRNGRLDSFSVTTPGGGRIDRDQTKACGDQLAGKLRN